MALLDLGSQLVTPSWLPLALVGVLLVLIGFLYWSMQRNIARISVPPAEPESTESESPAS